MYMALTTYSSKLKMSNWFTGFKWLFFTKPKNWALNRRVDGLKSESPIQPSLHPCSPEVQREEGKEAGWLKHKHQGHAAH